MDLRGNVNMCMLICILSLELFQGRYTIDLLTCRSYKNSWRSGNGSVFVRKSSRSVNV